MLFDILTFVLEVVVTLIGSACLLRLAMRWRRMSLANPVGRFVQALSDWMVVPLQRVVPPSGRLDTAALLGVWLLKLVQYALLLSLVGGQRWAALPVLALLGVAKLAVSVAIAVIVVAAVLSWTQNRTLLADVLQRLGDPLLAPLRRVIPLVGGIDLSPLVAVVVLQVLSMVIGSLQGSLLGTALGVMAGA